MKNFSLTKWTSTAFILFMLFVSARNAFFKQYDEPYRVALNYIGFAVFVVAAIVMVYVHLKKKTESG
jgi:hypothetical protein